MCALNEHTYLNIFILVQVLCVGGKLYWHVPCSCVLYLCVYVRSLTFRRISLVCGRSMQLTDSAQVRWKERLLVEIPLFATRRLCWSTLLRVIVHNVTSIDRTDGKRQPERENIFLSQTLSHSALSFILLFLVTHHVKQGSITKHICVARHDILKSSMVSCSY